MRCRKSAQLAFVRYFSYTEAALPIQEELQQGTATMIEMPLSYANHPQENIVYTTGEGRISLGDLQGHMRTVSEDSRFRPGMNTVVDLRNSQITMTIQEAPDLIRLFMQQAKNRKQGRWAVVIRRYPKSAPDTLFHYLHGAPALQNEPVCQHP